MPLVSFYTQRFFDVFRGYRKTLECMKWVNNRSSPSELFLGKGVLKINLQQIHWRTPMPKCDFNKVAKQLYWNHTLACVFSCKFAAYFKNTFSKEHLLGAASIISDDNFLVPVFQAIFLSHILHKYDQLTRSSKSSFLKNTVNHLKLADHFKYSFKAIADWRTQK